jgi:hypothetical protein
LHCYLWNLVENGAQKSPRQLERCGGLLCRVTAGGVAGRNLMSGALNCCFQCFPRAAENKKAHDSPKTVMGLIAGCSVVSFADGIEMPGAANARYAAKLASGKSAVKHSRCDPCGVPGRKIRGKNREAHSHGSCLACEKIICLARPCRF